MMLLAASISATLCMGLSDREAARAIMLDGVDLALKQHTVQIYENWLKDREEKADRFARGMNNALRAWITSRLSIRKWQPSEC